MAQDEAAPFDVKAFLPVYGGATVKYLAHSRLYTQGDAADAVFYIRQGKVQLSVISEHGKEAIIAVLNGGDLCGEGCLSGQTVRISAATTMTQCTIVRLEKASVIRAMHESPSFADFFFSYLLLQNKRLEEQLIDHLFNSSEQRLARTLLLLANYGQEAWEQTIISKIDQQMLAKMIGTTRGRVSHFMNKFRRLGFIQYDGDIRVHSSLLNVLMYDPSDTIGRERGDGETRSRRVGPGRSKIP